MSPSDFWKLVTMLWEKRDRLSDLLEKLPALLQEAGERIEEAGEGSVLVSRFMKGGPGVPVNARQSCDQAATVIQQANAQLGQVATVLGTLRAMLQDVEVPTVDVHGDTFNLGFGSVWLVTGVDVGTIRPLSSVAGQVQDVRQNLNTLRQNLSGTATQLVQLSTAFEGAGDRLEALGGKLQDGGQRLQELAT